MGKTQLLKQIDTAIDTMTGKRYCRSCLRSKEPSGGAEMINKGRKYGWRCKDCVARQKIGNQNRKAAGS